MDLNLRGSGFCQRFHGFLIIFLNLNSLLFGLFRFWDSSWWFGTDSVLVTFHWQFILDYLTMNSYQCALCSVVSLLDSIRRIVFEMTVFMIVTSEEQEGKHNKNKAIINGGNKHTQEWFKQSCISLIINITLMIQHPHTLRTLSQSKSFYL